MVQFRSLVAGLIDRGGYQLQRSNGARRGVLFRQYGIDLVFDVGAAIGKYAEEIRRYGFTGQIVSVEPLDQAFKALKSRAKNDPNWDVIKGALGAQSGTVEINVASNSDSSSLLAMLDRHLQAAPHTGTVGTQWTDVTTLDEIAPPLLPGRKAFVKIDTQGFEGAVLNGAANVLPQVAGVQLELSFVPLYEGGMLFREAIDRMLALGFDLVNLDPGFRDPKSQQLLQADAMFFRL